jgi:hypothetical protein
VSEDIQILSNSILMIQFNKHIYFSIYVPEAVGFPEEMYER